MNHFLITSLPPLPELGGAPPWTFAQLLGHLDPGGRAHELASLVFLGEDLLLRDAWRAGERELPEPAVLSAAQVRLEAPLPSPLAQEPGDASPRDAADAEWAAYFGHAAARAAARSSALLAAWVQHEVALRAALAKARAQLFGLEATGPAAGPAADLPGLPAVVAQWSQAPNALAALRLLDGARLAWIARNEPWFSFDDDELVAWALRLTILTRWQRLGGPDEPARRQAATPAAQGARA